MLKRNVLILLAACSLVATPLFAEDMSSGSQMNNTN
ncbi:TPA: type IV secretion protein Dot, partial [Legionella pneumophila]|nr:type IV secretion protein Dot [Legionella pneumophila subsp. pneumophila]HCR5123722.1 type IV secretion protein Dot [Legionella pneumophila]HCR5126764.1 type IV secretion protein Dot [Legionella pneumophila]HCR5129815.1 type IV secretion protein Dot [Legionella pneumophila]HCR5132869.1 type IV secretion protein Dot [Legionella pneumophila]